MPIAMPNGVQGYTRGRQCELRVNWQNASANSPIGLRRSRSTLVSGRIQFVSADRGVLRYERRGEEDRILMLLNMSMDPVRMTTESGTILASTHFDRDGQKVNVVFDTKAAEGLIIGLDHF